MKPNGRMTGQMGRFAGKSSRVARQYHYAGIEGKLIVRPGKTFQKPAAEKSCATGDEDALVPHSFPQPIV